MNISRITVRSLVAAGATLTLAALAGTPALAHDQLLSASPEEDSLVESTPEEIRLTFSGDGLITGQGIQNIVQVRDEAGSQWQDGDPTVTGPELSAPLCEGMPNGDYEVSYRVVYSDGHSEEKTYGFALDDPAAPASGAPADGCGVAVAAAASPTAASTETGTDTAQPDATATETPVGAAGPDDPATQPAGAAAGSGQTDGADPAAEQAQVDAAAQTTEAGQPLPAWVWVVGVGGVAVVLVALAMMFRRARTLNS